MRLISCYIENFGGLSKSTFKFNEGITEIQEQNGFGKTTLAEFIRAMFYGFPRATKSIEKNRRKKYAPWQGGKYGGNLVFEYKGVIYRIERTFDPVRTTADKFALYDMSTHNQCSTFSSNIGEELFQLDSESFERSTYFPQLHDTSPLSTGSIQTKLTDLVHDTGDVNNFEKALKALREKRTSFIPLKGQSGLVADAQAKIAVLETNICDAKSLYPELEHLKEDLVDKKQSLSAKLGAQEAIQEKVRTASETAGQASIKEQLTRLERELAEADEKVGRLSKKYSAGVPAMDEARSLLSVYDDIAPYLGVPESHSAYEEAMDWLRVNEQRFPNGAPSDDKISEYQSKLQDYAVKSDLLSTLHLSADEAEKLASLQMLFAHGVPSDDFLSSCRDVLQKRQSCTAEILKLSASLLDRVC